MISNQYYKVEGYKRKKLQLSKEWRPLIKKLPFVLRLLVLEYHDLINFPLHSPPPDLKLTIFFFFGKFKEDKFKKIFLCFKNIKVHRYYLNNKCKLPTKLEYFGIFNIKFLGIKNFKNLKGLVLENTRNIDIILKDVTNKLEYLEVLFIPPRHCFIDLDYIANKFKNLKGLRTCGIGNIHKKTILKCSKFLKILSVEYGYLKRMINLPSLKKISLVNVFLGNKITEDISNIKTIMEITLTFGYKKMNLKKFLKLNQLTKLGIEFVRGIYNDEELISILSLHFKLTNLKELTLNCHEKIPIEICIDIIKKNKKLKTFKLSYQSYISGADFINSKYNYHDILELFTYLRKIYYDEHHIKTSSSRLSLFTKWKFEFKPYLGDKKLFLFLLLEPNTIWKLLVDKKLFEEEEEKEITKIDISNKTLKYIRPIYGYSNDMNKDEQIKKCYFHPLEIMYL